jgi:glycosyltransferase involved in cell wall biosynthesis
MKKKILHISKYYYPYIGGVEYTCRCLAEELSDFENIVLCFNEKRKTLCEFINNVRVYRAGILLNIARQSLSFSYCFLLKEIIQKEKPDLIHFHCPNPFAAAFLILLIPKTVKLVLHWHLDIIEQKYIYAIIKPIENKLLKRADKILVTSPNYREASIPLSPFKDKINILPSAIKTKEFDLQPNEYINVRNIKELYNNKKIIFFVGRHVKYKGLVYLLEAEKYIKNDCHILIAGGGPLTRELQKKYMAKRISFIGRLNDNDLKYYLHAVDIFAFPSITKNEAFGLALIEAMYCNTSTVTFSINGSGVNWVALDDVTGIEVENRNVKAYAKAIDTLLSDDILRESYAKNGYNRVINEFTIEREIQTLTSYYYELLSIN